MVGFYCVQKKLDFSFRWSATSCKFVFYMCPSLPFILAWHIPRWVVWDDRLWRKHPKKPDFRILCWEMFMLYVATQWLWKASHDNVLNLYLENWSPLNNLRRGPKISPIIGYSWMLMCKWTNISANTNIYAEKHLSTFELFCFIMV